MPFLQRAQWRIPVRLVGRSRCGYIFCFFFVFFLYCQHRGAYPLYPPPLSLLHSSSALSRMPLSLSLFGPLCMPPDLSRRCSRLSENRSSASGSAHAPHFCQMIACLCVIAFRVALSVSIFNIGNKSCVINISQVKNRTYLTPEWGPKAHSQLHTNLSGYTIIVTWLTRFTTVMHMLIESVC